MIDAGETCIGRDAELAALARERRRLLTVHGAPGTGKTCLVRHHAARCESAVVVDLSRACDARGLCRAVARALGARPSVPAIARALRTMQVALVVLDHPERVAAHLPRALRVWLDAAPSLRVVVASQVRLGVPGERVLALGPLAPDDAAALFFARAHDARGRALPSDATTARAVASIVSATEGLPRDLERLALHALARSAAEITPDVDLLLAGDPALDAALARAGRAGRDAVIALSLFEGELTCAAAEATGTASAATLALLCDHALLRTHDRDEGTTFALPASVRRHARALLGARRGAARLRARFGRGMVTLATRASDALETPGAATSLARHRGDLERVASEALGRAETATAAACALALVALATMQGGVEEAAALLERVIARERALDVATRARLRHGRARLARRSGRPDAALRDYARAAALAARAGDFGLSALVATDRAGLLRHLGRHDEARALYQRALATHVARGDARGRGRTLSSLASMHLELGDLETARALFAEAVAALDASDDRLALAMARQNLGLVEQESGELERAEQTFREALVVHRALGNRRFEAISELDLAGLQLERGRPDEAVDGLQRARAIAQTSGDRREHGLAAALLGACHAMRGALSDAERALAEARRALHELGEPGLRRALELHEAHALLAAAHQARAERDTRRSAALIAQVDALLESAERERASGDELRFALRVLRAERARWESLARSAIIARDGTWFVIPARAPVTLTRRPVLARILRALLAQHLRDPSAPLAPASVVRAGWPGERTLASASRNRLHVAIATLRKLGLEAHLRSHRGGYLLERVAAHEPELES